jgi:hypothetical protein
MMRWSRYLPASRLLEYHCLMKTLAEAIGGTL